MFEPLNIFKSIKENYKIMFKDYNVWIWIVNFICLPLIFAIYFTKIFDFSKFVTIINSSVIFFSIIVGFLINVLILMVNTKKISIQNLDKGEKEIEERKELLIRNLSYNILTEIFFGIMLVLMIIFLSPYKWEIMIQGFNLILSQFLILLLFGYFIVSLINILSKFGVYLLTRFNK